MRNFEVGSTQCMGGTKETMALYHRLAMDMGIPDSILLVVYCYTLDKKYPPTPKQYHALPCGFEAQR